MNAKLEAFQDFLTVQSLQVPVWGFILNLVIAAILAFIVGLFYVQFANTLSNRSQFARQFVLLAMATTLIISIVKSSLALSLGLVGALSIVRFRAAIKEPEELVYLFLIISIGLGLGAGQRLITIIAILIILGVIVLQKLKQFSFDKEHHVLMITSEKKGSVNLEMVTDVLKKHCDFVHMRRFDESSDRLSATFIVEFKTLATFHQAKKALDQLGSSISLTLMDNKGLL